MAHDISKQPIAEAFGWCTRQGRTVCRVRFWGDPYIYTVALVQGRWEVIT